MAPGERRRRILPWGALLLVGVLLLEGAYVSPDVRGSPPAAPSPLTRATVQPTSSHLRPAAVGPFAVSGDDIGPPVNDTARVRAHYFLAGGPSPNGTGAGVREPSSLPGGMPSRAAMLQQLTARSSRATDRNAPRTAGASLGSFRGYVNDSGDGLGIAGVNVTEISVACTGTLCGGTTTSSDGSFEMSCATGVGLQNNYELIVDNVSWWMNNDTYATCSAGNVTNVGTIFLVRDGVVSGIVRDAATGSPVANVLIVGISRDGLQIASPWAYTSKNGTFRLAVPAVASKLYVYPTAPYLATFNYTDAPPGTGTRPGHPPWSGGVDEGTIYLSETVNVTATLVDAATNRSATVLKSSLEACSGVGLGCSGGGPPSSNDTVTGTTVAGPQYFEIVSAGYVTAYTTVREVPQEPPSQAYNLGPIDLQPLGAVLLKADLSRPAGGTVPWTNPSTPNGTLVATVCSLDGYQFSAELDNQSGPSSTCVHEGCWNPGTSFTVYAPPLRDSIQISPDLWNSCGNNGYSYGWGGAADAPPVWQNETIVNLTAGRLLSLGGPITLGLSVGDYVAGTVDFPQGPPPPMDCLLITDTSTDNAEFDQESYNWSSCSPDWAPCQAFGPQPGPYAFCIGLPPGNSRVEASMPGYSPNWTWASVPLDCCGGGSSGPGYPATLANATGPRISIINLTATGSSATAANFSGYVVTAGASQRRVPDFSVEVCPAAGLSVSPCNSGYGSNGSFEGIQGPTGPDVLTFAAAGFQANSVWANGTVNATTNAGTVPLYEDGTIAGQVVDPNGTGLFLASVTYCAVYRELPCLGGGGAPLGLGYTSSDGTFNGTVPGGWLPWATYVVVASAAGYLSDWTVVNVSAGGYVTVPTLVLPPVGDAPARPALGGDAPPAPRPAGPSAAWLDGRVVDNSSGAGVAVAPGVGLEVCLLPALTCTGLSDGSNVAGYFNTSLLPGLYYLNISTPGYVPKSVFFNATGVPVVHLGTLRLEPLPWIAGRLVIDPWRSLTLAGGGSFSRGLGPAADVVGCSSNALVCGVGVPDATDGAFNVSVPPGSSAVLEVSPSGGGYVKNATPTTLSGTYTTQQGSAAYLGLSIYGIVEGRVFDNDSTNGSSADLYGVPFATLQVVESGTYPGGTDVVADGGGSWVAFLPGGDGKNAVSFQVDCAPGYASWNQRVSDPVVSGDAVTVAPDANLTRYGWVVTQFVSGADGAPLPNVLATADAAAWHGLGSRSTSEEANDDGWLNLTAPFGPNVVVSYSAPDFNYSSFTVPEIYPETTYFEGGTGYRSLHPTSLPPYGWVDSFYQNYSPAPPPLLSLPAPSVIDPTNGQGVPSAVVTVSSTDPAIPSGGSAPTNWAGQFASDAPIGGSDVLLVEAGGYLANATPISVTAGSYAKLRTLNLTGDAIVTGSVLSLPYDTPVPGATVEVCPLGGGGTGGCLGLITNLSGVYWAAVPPGSVEATGSLSGYTSNTSVGAGCSDCWSPLPPIYIASFASVEGVVRGLPDGFPLANASVSLCFTYETPPGPCGAPVQTDADGRFLVQAGPGEFDLAAVAPDYNVTYVALTLAAGSLVSVGTLFLEEYGSVVGTVINGSSGEAVPSAQLLACPTYSEGSCASIVDTDANGRYAYVGAPGSYSVQVTAPGYAPLTTSSEVSSGVTDFASPIAIYPAGAGTPIPLSGEVVRASNSSQPVRNALVAALVDGQAVATAPVNGSGGFVLHVAEGSYLLRATASGFAAAFLTVVATVPESGLLFRLSPAEFTVHGTVTDGLSGHPIAGALVGLENGSSGWQPLAVAGPGGGFQVLLANGSTTLEARAPVNGTVAYVPSLLAVTVDGFAQEVNFTLTPARVELHLSVDDALTGLGLVGAAVSVVGQIEPGVTSELHGVAGSQGQLSLGLYAATYLLTVSAAGYAPVQMTIQAVAPTLNESVSLRPGGPSGGTSAASPDLLAFGVAAAVGLVAVVLAVLLWLRRRPSAPRLVPAELVDDGPFPPEAYELPPGKEGR